MKKNLLLLGITAVIMIGLPGLAVALLPPNAGMLVSVAILFGFDPVWSAILGFLAGEEIKKHWFLPLAAALLFLVGGFLFLSKDPTAFLGYAAVYCIISTLVMLAASYFFRKTEKKTEESGE